MVACRIFKTFKVLIGTRAGLLVLTLAVFSCGCLWGQTLPANRLPDSISERAPSDISWDRSSHEAPPGQQLVTANALRAPDKARKAFQKASKAMLANQVDEAAKEIALALEYYPDYAQALTLRGLMNLSTARKLAIEDLKQAIRLDPSYGMAYAILASSYNDAESYDDAFPVVSRALQLLPTAWQAHFEMARTLWGRHQSADALKEIGNAMRLSTPMTTTPESRAALHFWCGRILIDQHDFSSAKVEFQHALSEDPNGIFAPSSSLLVSRLEAVAIR